MVALLVNDVKTSCISMEQMLKCTPCSDPHSRAGADAAVHGLPGVAVNHAGFLKAGRGLCVCVCVCVWMCVWAEEGARDQECLQRCAYHGACSASSPAFIQCSETNVQSSKHRLVARTQGLKAACLHAWTGHGPCLYAAWHSAAQTQHHAPCF